MIFMGYKKSSMVEINAYRRIIKLKTDFAPCNLKLWIIVFFLSLYIKSDWSAGSSSSTNRRYCGII